MARRYGGRFSPEASPDTAPRPKNPFDGQRPARAGLKANLLFLLPLPLAMRAFVLPATELALTLAGFALAMLAAWLTREGERAQEAYDARKVARRPAIPRKLMGAVALGLGLGLAASTDGGLIGGLLLGLVAAVLHVGAFGADPLRSKGAEGLDRSGSDRAARAVEAAEAVLAEMAAAIARTRDRQLETRVAGFAGTARRMFRTVEEDPRDLTSAKKYLTVYLTGARDASIKFADLQSRRPDPARRAEYTALLDDLEQSYSARTEALLTDDRAALDVEIGVLRERLDREGVRT